MSDQIKPRLRFFEQASGQRHITEDDQYLYASDQPSFRLGLIGSGTIGQEHMHVATLLGRAKIHGIYDKASHSMDVAGEEFAKYATHDLVHYQSLEAICQDPDNDALMICTPNFTHYELLKTAIKSEKPIFLEKPMATTLKDAANIVEISNQYPSFIQVGLQYRYKAIYVEAQHEALQRNALGQLKTISMREYRPPFLDKVRQWNKFNEYTGGTLVEKCCHYFDLINLFADSEPKSVFASGGQAVNFRHFKYQGKNSDIDDHAMVIIEYRNGIRASFELNMFCPNFYEELILCGDRGRLLANETFNFQQSDYSQSKISIELGESGASRDIKVAYPRMIEQSGHHGATFFEHQAFVDQLEGNKTNSATPLQGLWSIIIASAAQQSVQTGRCVSIDDFIGDNDLAKVLGW